MTRWKDVERGVARLLGGIRVPVTGRGRGDAPDILHPTYSIEVKTRQTLPAWIVMAFDQAKKSARPGQTPVVILHRKGWRYRDAIVCVRLDDFIRLQGDDNGNNRDGA